MQTLPDADDPACTFQTSRDGYEKGQWVSNLNTKNERRMEVHVRSDLRQGSVGVPWCSSCRVSSGVPSAAGLV